MKKAELERLYTLSLQDGMRDFFNWLDNEIENSKTQLATNKFTDLLDVRELQATIRIYEDIKLRFDDWTRRYKEDNPEGPSN